MRTEMRPKQLALILAILACTYVAPAIGQTVLIYPAEAQKQDAAIPNDDLGGFTLSPKLVQVQPKPTTPVTSPFHLVVRFEAQGDATIEIKKVNLVYEKIGQLDITDRVRPALKADGIDLEGVILPAGRHVIRVDLVDTVGKHGTGYLDILVINPSLKL